MLVDISSPKQTIMPNSLLALEIEDDNLRDDVCIWFLLHPAFFGPLEEGDGVIVYNVRY